jgi:hypothetical protein
MKSLHAATVTLSLLCVLVVSGSAEELGRLFFTPQERQALNAKRELGAKPAVVAAVPGEGPGPVEDAREEPESVIVPEPSVTGFVIRSSGNNTVWVNQRPNYGEQLSPSALPALRGTRHTTN